LATHWGESFPSSFASVPHVFFRGRLGRENAAAVGVVASSASSGLSMNNLFTALFLTGLKGLTVRCGGASGRGISEGLGIGLLGKAEERATEAKLGASYLETGMFSCAEGLHET
jgi:hypothetical protein